MLTLRYCWETEQIQIGSQARIYTGTKDEILTPEQVTIGGTSERNAEDVWAGSVPVRPSNRRRLLAGFSLLRHKWDP